MMRHHIDKDLLQGIIAGFIIALLIILLLSVCVGCKSCEPIIKKEFVNVEVPIAVPGPELPLPEPLQCVSPESELDGWRDDAQFIKDCWDAALLKIEELIHVITSYNETRSHQP